jgi:hypothetical protein
MYCILAGTRFGITLMFTNYVFLFFIRLQRALSTLYGKGNEPKDTMRKSKSGSEVRKEPVLLTVRGPRHKFVFNLSATIPQGHVKRVYRRQR